MGAARFTPGQGPQISTKARLWRLLAGVYHMMGGEKDARNLFERAISMSGDLGLLTEEIDPPYRRQLGNFPQALSHFTLGERRVLRPRRHQRHGQGNPKHSSSRDENDTHHHSNEARTLQRSNRYFPPLAQQTPWMVHELRRMRDVALGARRHTE